MMKGALLIIVLIAMLILGILVMQNINEQKLATETGEKAGLVSRSQGLSDEAQKKADDVNKRMESLFE